MNGWHQMKTATPMQRPMAPPRLPVQKIVMTYNKIPPMMKTGRLTLTGWK